MKNFKLVPFLALSAAFLAGCGDESTTVNETTGISQLAKGEALPGCSESNAGEMLFAADSGLVYYCANGEWQTLNGKDGADGKDGSDGSDGTSGESCEAVALEDGSGYKILCGKDSVGVVKSGADGLDGKSSVDTLIVSDTLVLSKLDTLLLSKIDTVVVSKRDTLVVKDTTVLSNVDTLFVKDTLVISNIDTVVVLDTVLGLNGASCTAEELEDGSGYKILCGEDSVGVVKNGKDGTDGKDGLAKVPEGEYNCDTFKCVTTAFLNPAIEYGELLDTRDSQVYRTVKIGSQVWMAQNLNYYYYDVTDTSLLGEAYCYQDSTQYCETYGRLYSWSAAMGFGRTYNSTLAGDLVQIPHRGVCPQGFHMPDSAEFAELIAYVDDNSAALGVETSLKAKMGWNNPSGGGGLDGADLFGFSALPAGENHTSTNKLYYHNVTYFITSQYVGDSTFFWSAKEDKTDSSKARSMHLTLREFANNSDYKKLRLSVRCLKDSDQ